MKEVLKNRKLTGLLGAASALLLFFYGDYILFMLISIFIFLFYMVKIYTFYPGRKIFMSMAITFSLLLSLQIVAYTLFVFNTDIDTGGSVIRKLAGIVLILLPALAERLIAVFSWEKLSMPSTQEIGTVSFELMNDLKGRLDGAIHKIEKARKTASAENINQILEDIPRHSSIKYINNGSLTEQYFSEAYGALEDKNIYIVVSCTGSAASEIISLFTHKEYNHVSLAFDQQLKTIVSYNGGERVYPPGLNYEMISFFHKKKDASILVYRLHAELMQNVK